MSSKALQDTLRQLRKARATLEELEEQLYDYLEEKLEIKEELIEVVEKIVENVDVFDDVATVETLILACASKPVPSRAHRRNAGKKTKDEVIQTVRERRGTAATPVPASTVEEVD